MWSDNDTSIDLLGFQHLVGAVTSIASRPQLLPATIGVFGDWGSGKSSLLRMAAAELGKGENVLVLSFNGWLFEGYEDAKIALMGTILDGIAERKSLAPKAKERLAGMLKRLDWFRVLGAGLKYGAAFALAGPAGLGLAAAADTATLAAQAGEKLGAVSLDEGAKFLRDGGQEHRRAVREFRNEFDALLQDTDIKTLVVVIDDLDRCLPDTIIETLEAIKLFLFTPRTAFIIGADERLVKYAVRKRFPELPGHNAEVGRDYLEKLIQFPVHIPPLDAPEMETFINLLFLELAELPPPQCEAARQRALGAEANDFSRVRFNYGVAKDLFTTVSQPLADGMDLAQRVAPVLTAGLSGNPRQCKRFLNTLMMRLAMARSKRLPLSQTVLAKMMLLEYLKPEWFKQLARLQAAQEGRPVELAEMEKVASGGKATRTIITGNEAQSAEPKVSEQFSSWIADPWMKDWLVSEPSLSAIDLRPYFYFSRDILGPLGGDARRLSPLAQDLLQKLLHESQAQRAVAGREATQLPPADAAAVLASVCQRVGREDTIDIERSPTASLLVLVEARPELRGQMVTFISSLPDARVPASLPMKLAGLLKGTDTAGAVRQLLQRWSPTGGKTPLAKAARKALERLT